MERTIYLTCPHCLSEDASEEADQAKEGEWTCRECRKAFVVIDVDFLREDDLVFLTEK